MLSLVVRFIFTFFNNSLSIASLNGFKFLVSGIFTFTNPFKFCLISSAVQLLTK